MINNLLEEKECSLSFLKFRTKQKVQKRKLDVELVKQKWKFCSAGFRDDNFVAKNRKRLDVKKIVIGAVPNRSYDDGHKSKIVSHPTRIDLLPSKAKPINTKVCSQSFENLDDSSIAKNTLKQRHDSSKRTSSVFLEVQNIQGSFQRSKLDDNLKNLVPLPSEFTKKFKAELLSQHKKQKNKSNQPQSLLQIKSHPQVFPNVTNFTLDPAVRNHEELEKKHKIQNYVQKNIADICFKSSKIALCDLKIDADSPSKLVDSTADTQGSIIDNKCMKVTEFTQKLKTNLSSKGQKLKSPRISQFQNLNFSPQIKPHSKLSFPLPESSKTIQQLQIKTTNLQNDTQKENVESSRVAPFHFQIKADFLSKPKNNVQNMQKSFLDDKSIQVFTQCSKKFTTDLISKKKSVEQDVFQNSFGEDKFSVKPHVALPSMFAKKDRASLLPKKKEQQENVPRKLKMDQSSFIIPSVDFSHSNEIFNVKKRNSVILSINSELTSLDKKAPNESHLFATNLEASIATSTSNQLIDFDVVNEKSLQASYSKSEITSVAFSKLLDSKSLGSKGSNWMQSLKPEENETTDHEESVSEEKIRNIVPGGLTEQLLKLQKRESTVKAIWNHKIHQSNKKVLKTSLCFVLTSISLTEELVIAKASSAPHMEPQTDGKDQTSFQHSKVNPLNLDDFKDVEIVIILFKRKAFSEMCLKVNDVFRLYQPWQTLHIQSIPYPIIICAYFLDVISRGCPYIPNEVVAENITTIPSTYEPASLLKRNIQQEDVIHGDMLFFKREELVTFSARIQRVWKKEFVKNTSSPACASKYVRYSVLLQVKEGTFHELRLLPGAVPSYFYYVISEGEGKCFFFHNLCVTHRTPLKRDKYLQKILDAIHQRNGSTLMQDFCYQLMFDGSSTIPEEICENGFPDYCPITIEPLQKCLKKETQERFTCMGKVLLKNKNIFYISDDSLLSPLSSKCYTELYFLMIAECTSSLVGSTVLIKEALVEEDGLLVDNYAQLIPLCESSNAYQSLSSENKMKVKLQQSVSLKNAISFLHIGSDVLDIVCIQGEVESVDEDAAFTWIQCSFCLQENLVEDSNLVIYCEDCSKIVPKPILNVNMEVVIHCQMLASAKVHVQLLSTTVKRIWQVPEGSCQPQRRVSDILGKEIGPLYCCVQNREVASDKSIFYLSEVDTI